MRIRYLSWLGLAIAAAFLVVASTTFALFDIMNIALGVGIGMLVVSLFIAYRYRDHVPSLVTGAVSAIVSTWTIVASQVFSLHEVQNLTLASGLALAALAVIGLTENELSSERVVHSLTVEGARNGNADLQSERARMAA
jgi:thiamine transporter ThiT